jgi:hypothetical protein
MNKSNSSLGLFLVGFSILLSMTALIAVAAHWPDRGHMTTTVMMPARQAAVAAPVKNVNIVMKDPGCHWFQTNSGLKDHMAIKGPMMLTNMDEAALKVVGPTGTKIQSVGAHMRLAPGAYTITMVGQASDDNHLKLTVS